MDKLTYGKKNFIVSYYYIGAAYNGKEGDMVAKSQSMKLANYIYSHRTLREQTESGRNLENFKGYRQ